MKVPRALLFSALLLSALGVTVALSQTRTGNDTQRTQVPVVASPFQALGNVLQNPDADRPPPRRRPGTPPPTIIPR
ncbi:MAG: hypothetical protein ACXWLX_14530 [Rhizomicrobium sp.]